MEAAESDILAQELEFLNSQIQGVDEKRTSLEGNLAAVDSELALFADDRKRFDALRTACNALDTLDQMEAAHLFWDGVAGGQEASSTHLAGMREKIIAFEKEINVSDEKKRLLEIKINECHADVDDLQYDIRAAHAREERRLSELIVDREISDAPRRPLIMPWAGDQQTRKDLRRSLLIALLLCFFWGSVIPMISVPVPDRAEVVKIPERLAKLVKKEKLKPKPKPKPKKVKEKDKEKPKEKKSKEKKVAKTSKPQTTAEKKARKKAYTTGVLAFKNSFDDLMDETPVAGLGANARLSKSPSGAKGGRRASRSLVAMQAAGGSGGISSGAVSRNVGSGGGDRIGGGVGFSRVESGLAGLTEEEGRPVTEGAGPARTDEEIQIVFDRYKALLYRIYNKELRKNPTLRGKLLLQMTIESDGSVSACTVKSTDLASPPLVAKIVARVKKFNFGAKDGVPKTTIIYPIDFLPAG